MYIYIYIVYIYIHIINKQRRLLFFRRVAVVAYLILGACNLNKTGVGMSHSTAGRCLSQIYVRLTRNDKPTLRSTTNCALAYGANLTPCGL